jgi:CubicO group peptidase (beta-lactamase class C family)
MKKAIPALILLLSSFSVFASDQVDDFVVQHMEKKQIPGLALLVVQDGKIVKEQGYGFANLEHRVPVKPETIFQSGSMGKQFTATLVMMLVEEGKVRLDDPVGKYLGKVPGKWKDITVRNLLTHTSGLGDYPADFDFRKDYTEDEEFEIMKKQPLLFHPGEKWSYSNLGYLTLGVLIHKVSGKFYGDFLQERVFRPLGMSSTRVISEADIIPNRAAGYVIVKGQIKNQEWVSPTLNTTADGSLYFNIVDLAKWDEALYTEKLLKKSSLDEMWTPVKLTDGSTYPYGFGWSFAKPGGHRLIEHGGSWQGFRSQIARYVDDRLTVVVLANSADANPEFISHCVAGLYLSAVAPPKHIRADLEDKALEALAGEYKFDSGMTVRITAEKNKLVAHYGESAINLLPESATSFFVEDSESTVAFTKNDKGQIAGLVWNAEEKAKKIK